MRSRPATARRPAFLVTIDTEGDNLWARPREILTKNSAFLPRFQALCERFGQRPTWLTNHEMAMCPVYREFAHDVLARNVGEVGMHLHAWNSPPVVPLTADDFRYQPFLIEYPEPIMREKVRRLTSLLEDTFGVPMRSHRAGRWALDSTYAQVLVEAGYSIDCSVTPTIDWSGTRGAPGGNGGANYTAFPAVPYYIDLSDIGRRGTSPLLEVPMTTRQAYPRASRMVPRRLQSGPLRRLRTSRLWLRPRGRNRAEMLELVARGAAEGWPHLEFMLHSSEFMPGGSPTFPDERAIEHLFEDLEVLFSRVAATCEGMTLSEFAASWQADPAAAGCSATEA